MHVYFSQRDILSGSGLIFPLTRKVTASVFPRESSIGNRENFHFFKINENDTYSKGKFGSHPPAQVTFVYW